MSGRELELVRKVFKSNWIAPVGPDVDAFEKEFAGYMRDKDVPVPPNAVALSSGTAGIHLALRILGAGKGDEVFCPSLTFCASAIIMMEGT
jgi:pyridoxal phosphate-dependent aminotransferase EpsN